MKTSSTIRIIFGASAVYDGILGIIGLLFPYFLFTTFDVTPPNHPGYVQFPGALLIVFALMFTAIALNPRANRNLIPYGILLKLSYAGVVFYYWLGPGLPNMWKPFALADTVFMLLFVWAYMKLTTNTSKAA
ncbi:MAG: hypothetical protein AB3N63_09120 [Puniceicoccaceae bacterium]